MKIMRQKNAIRYGKFLYFLYFSYFYIFIFVSTVKSIMIAKLQNTRALT